MRIILAGYSSLRLNVVRYAKANCIVYGLLHSVSCPVLNFLNFQKMFRKGEGPKH